MLDDIRQARLDKLNALRAGGVNPYPPSCLRTHAVREVVEGFDRLASDAATVTVAGRVMTLRAHGGSAFFDIEDGSGRIQAYAKKDLLGPEAYKRFTETTDVGDIMEVEGTLFTTKKGERTVEARRVAMLTKTLLPLPEKWHGLTDQEERYRKRYLDLATNPEVRGRFAVRAAIVKTLRDAFHEAGFMEVETPMLQTVPGGALATPFATHMDTLNLPLYLRVAPELYLKRLLVGGFEKVFEIGRCFRNEGMDRDHNPDFTMLEAYAAWHDYEWLMGFTENLFVRLAREAMKDAPIALPSGEVLSFVPPFPRVDLNDVVASATGLDFWDNTDGDYLRVAKDLGITVEKAPTKAAVFDELFKKVARPKMQQPTFVINHPLEISPLAKAHRTDPRKVERFQLVVGGVEVANAFTELNDPLDQRARFEAQEAERAKGDSEGHRMDEDFIEALEHGMPPAAGIGIGVDRLVKFFTGADTLREVILFPTMKPKS